MFSLCDFCQNMRCFGCMFIAWNVAHNHWSKGCRNCSISVSSCGKSKDFLRFTGTYNMDILLDVDEGIMRLQLIHPTNSDIVYPELKCWNMPSKQNAFQNDDDFQGYVPQFNIGTKVPQLRLAKIPCEYYGDRNLCNIFEE